MEDILIPLPFTHVKGRGDVELIIEYADGRVEKLYARNTLLRNGKIAIASSLANEVNEPYNFYISKMIFGTGGTEDGTPRYVDESRNGLFSGTPLLSKNVISTVDPAAPTTAIFTSVILYDEGVGSTLNEMALQMKNGNLYSMLCFPDFGKTTQIQITFNWTISIL